MRVIKTGRAGVARRRLNWEIMPAGAHNGGQAGGFPGFKNVPVSCILGIGVYNEIMLDYVENILNSFNMNNIICKVKNEWYY